jgi:RHS repeat-associated protein
LTGVSYQQQNASANQFAYYYSYNQAGRVTTNTFQASNGSTLLANLAATYAWDNQGRMTNMTYPSGPQLAYQYDAMGRLSQITSPNYPSNQPAAVTATYTGIGQLSTLNYGGQYETRGYNSLLQLTSMVTGGVSGTLLSMQYNYTAGQNNGRVAQTVDGVLGETVNYTYDMWNRLSSATATNGNWGKAYTYDNFGNLTGKTPTAGTAPSMNVGAGPATNQTMGGSYDANGNWVGGVPYYPNTWDVENRLVATANSTQATNYSYDPWGRRMWTEIPGQTDSQNNQLTNTTCEIYFYGVTGQKLETYSCSYTGGGFVSSLEGINVYFGKKLVQSKGAWVVTDKLGTVRANASLGAMNYFPYGEERTSTANDVEKFGTYTRDAVGQDYAQQRYYNSSVGAFWSPDPGGIRTANPRNPLSWNRYAYTKGNPIGRLDRHGLEDCDPDDDEECQESYCDLNPEDPICNDLPGGGDPGPSPTPSPSPFVCPPKYQSFINAHGADAVATGLSEPNVLALAAIESGWGNGRFAQGGNSFFNLETVAPIGWKPGDALPKTIYADQASWMNALEPFASGPDAGRYALVATYNNASDAFKSFAAKDGQFLSGVTDPATFGSIAVAHGINAGRGQGFITTEATFQDCLKNQ